eukprot:CAMPEP_0170774514 /NCGR_PEP_ID=MMETSP0733-20121128/9998_1 /TAXON_ID=186038 /ORGANISM="Fragilariopsis kerguelensis, Strain L26-C5" /LENGTH=45 /DNA_ID= /DNA_START= /DNA_END= /DNA_ORIENTATION=
MAGLDILDLRWGTVLMVMVRVPQIVSETQTVPRIVSDFPRVLRIE